MSKRFVDMLRKRGGAEMEGTCRYLETCRELFDILNSSEEVCDGDVPKRLRELFEFFSTWEQEAKDRKHFITREAFYDMKSTVYATVCFLRHYCPGSGKRKCVLRRLSQDMCEQLFSFLRGRGFDRSMSAETADSGVRAAQNGGFNGSAKGNSGSVRTTTPVRRWAAMKM